MYSPGLMEHIRFPTKMNGLVANGKPPQLNHVIFPFVLKMARKLTKTVSAIVFAVNFSVFEHDAALKHSVIWADTMKSKNIGEKVKLYSLQSH